jgi:hypothetical protein
LIGASAIAFVCGGFFGALYHWERRISLGVIIAVIVLVVAAVAWIAWHAWRRYHEQIEDVVLSKFGVTAVIQDKQIAGCLEPLLGGSEFGPAPTHIGEFTPGLEATLMAMATRKELGGRIQAGHPDGPLGQARRQKLQAGAGDHPQAGANHDEPGEQQQGPIGGGTVGAGRATVRHGEGVRFMLPTTLRALTRLITTAAGPAQLAHHASQQGEIIVGELGALEESPELGHAGVGRVGQEETHLQEQGFRIGEGRFNGTPWGEGLGGDQGLGGDLLPTSLPLAEGPEVMEHHRHGMGQVEGGVDGGGRDVEQAAGLKELVIGEAPILPAKDQGRPPVRVLAWLGSVPLSQKPGESFSRGSQGQGRSLQPTRGRHNPGAIGQGGGQVGIDHGLLQVGCAMHRHLAGFRAEGITPGSH